MRSGSAVSRSSCRNTTPGPGGRLASQVASSARSWACRSTREASASAFSGWRRRPTRSSASDRSTWRYAQRLRAARLGRARQRPALRGGAGGAPRGRCREPGEERLPRRDEPRDPDADERDHRHERPPARHARSSDEQRDYAETIRDSGEALLTIINDILDFSKIEAGRVELDSRAVRPRARASRAPSTSSRRRRARRASSSPTRSSPDVPASARAATAVGCGRSSSTCSSNAREVHRAGRGGAERAAGAPSTAADATSDLGDHGRRARHRHRHPARPGRPALRLVQPGRRLDRRGATAAPASGSRSAARLAELMDGTLTAESSGVPGEGSTFHLRVPGPGIGDAPHAPGRWRTRPGRPHASLIVDDNATNRRILAAHARRWGVTRVARRRRRPTRRSAARADAAAVRRRPARPPHAGHGRRRRSRARDPARDPATRRRLIILASSLGVRDASRAPEIGFAACCPSRSSRRRCSTRWSTLLAGRRAGRATAAPADAGGRREPAAGDTRSASCSPRTTP